jgi:hypothetical protein
MMADFLNHIGYDKSKKNSTQFENFYEGMWKQPYNGLPNETTGSFGRRAGKPLIIFSGHGSWNAENGYVQVPKASRFVFFIEHMKTLSDQLGGHIESAGSLLGNLPAPDSEYQQYSTMPNYTLHPPYNPTLNIQKLDPKAQRANQIFQVILKRNARSMTLRQLIPVLESQLPKNIVLNGIDYFWACCRAVDFKREVGGEAIGVNAMQR